VQLVLGLDFGTQGVKGLVIDSSGKIIFRSYQEYPTALEGDKAEQDSRLWLSSMKKVIQLLRQSCDLSQVKAIGISAQMHGFVAVDAAGIPLNPAHIWADSRSRNETTEMRPLYKAREYPNPCEPVYTAPKLCWFKRHLPDQYKKTYKFLFPKDYIKHVLCGCFTTEHTDA
jgi:xylulokinase